MSETRVLVGKGALVTGGGSGLGFAGAARLISDGATVTIAGRNEDRLRAAAQRLAAECPSDAEVRWARCDVTDEASVNEAVEISSAGCGLHMVVASAGRGAATAPIAQLDVETFRSVLDTNLTGVFLTLKHAAPKLRAAGGGAFIAISSGAAILTVPYASAYATSKAAVDAFVRTAADELGAWDIRVNSIRPGFVPTEMSAALMNASHEATSYIAGLPLNRVGTPNDVASAIRYLCGPEAAWVTGTCFEVDGGRHLRTAPDRRELARSNYGDEWIAAD
jgi:NAD(P)-dependent dehydrogenase (short-subunit alcohol dehydrogenase family)